MRVAESPSIYCLNEGILVKAACISLQKLRKFPATIRIERLGQTATWYGSRMRAFGK